jgi:hypothetical protein
MELVEPGQHEYRGKNQRFKRKQRSPLELHGLTPKKMLPVTIVVDPEPEKFISDQDPSSSGSEMNLK